MSTNEPIAEAEKTWVARFRRVGGDRYELDLDTPVSAGAGFAEIDDCRILFAGRLHNRAELAADLNETDPGASDTEIVARAYLRRREAILPKLRGIFALAVADNRNAAYFCARDQLGLHSLFHAAEGDDVLLSPSVDALIRQPHISSTVNVAALVDHLRRRWPFAEETYFEAVRRVPPAHILRLGRTQGAVRYWEPIALGDEIDWVEPADVDRFGDVLELAVKRCSGKPAGIFLSGGLDSVSVAAVAAAHAREDDAGQLWALSLAFPRADVNEEPIQRRVAADLRLPQVMLAWDDAVGPQGLLVDALDLSSRAPGPLGNFWAPAYDRLAQEGKRRGCQTIITGSGGDEWLGVSPYLAADLLRTFDLPGVYRLFSASRRSYQLSTVLFLRNVLWRFGARPLLARTAKRLSRRLAPDVELSRRLRNASARTPSWVAPAPGLREQIMDRERRAYADLVESEEEWLSKTMPWRYPRNYLLEGRTALTHPLMAIEHEETFEQAQRLELPFLQPYWDVDVIEFLYRTPPELLNRGGWAKGLVRETLARRFPELGFERQRKVVSLDFARTLFREEGLRAWELYGGVSALSDAGIVDAGEANRTVEAIRLDPDSRSTDRIWDLLTCEAWFRARL